MSTLEDRLYDALGADPGGTASPDLFARVLDDISDDRARRRRRHHTLTAWFVGVVLVSNITWFTTPKRNGRLLMHWWILELATTVVLAGVALWLGPFIKRFGRAYAADVFHDNPQTGKSYIVLTDIVYYLIFAAYLMFSVHFEPSPDWAANVTAAQLTFETARVGGILLIIGVLHGVNIVLMPFLGRLFSLNRKLSGGDEGVSRR